MPFNCGSFPDLSIARDGLHYMLLDGEKYIADSGYTCQQAIIPDDAITWYERLYMSTARARHETINQLFKQFKVIRNRFERHVKRHGLFVHSIAQIIQLGIMNKEIIPYDVTFLPEPETWPRW